MTEPGSSWHPAGDRVEADYWTVRRRVGVVRREDLAVLGMRGKDPIRMLNGLITNDLGSLSAGQAVYGAMLTPKGRMITDLSVLRNPGADPAELTIVLPRVAVDDVMAHLTKYVPPMFARVEAAQKAVIGVYGPLASKVVTAVLSNELPGNEDGVSWSGGDLDVAIVRATVVGRGSGFDLVVDVTAVDDLLQRLGKAAEANEGGSVREEAIDMLRVEAGVPRFGLDMTDESMPAEVFSTTGMMDHAVSFTKGCYTGQEVVVRIAHRGHVNRSLRGLRLGTERPEGRTALFGENGKEVGWITSVAYSPIEGEVIGLAMIRREVDSGAALRVGAPDGPAASVVDLPFGVASIAQDA